MPKSYRELFREKRGKSSTRSKSSIGQLTDNNEKHKSTLFTQTIKETSNLVKPTSANVNSQTRFFFKDLSNLSKPVEKSESPKIEFTTQTLSRESTSTNAKTTTNIDSKLGKEASNLSRIQEKQEPAKPAITIQPIRKESVPEKPIKSKSNMSNNLGIVEIPFDEKPIITTKTTNVANNKNVTPVLMLKQENVVKQPPVVVNNSDREVLMTPKRYFQKNENLVNGPLRADEIFGNPKKDKKEGRKKLTKKVLPKYQQASNLKKVSRRFFHQFYDNVIKECITLISYLS